MNVNGHLISCVCGECATAAAQRSVEVQVVHQAVELRAQAQGAALATPHAITTDDRVGELAQRVEVLERGMARLAAAAIREDVTPTGIVEVLRRANRAMQEKNDQLNELRRELDRLEGAQRGELPPPPRAA